jgi:hypothetical protein
MTGKGSVKMIRSATTVKTPMTTVDVTGLAHLVNAVLFHASPFLGRQYTAAMAMFDP